MRSNTIILGGFILLVSLVLSTLHPSKINRPMWVTDRGVVADVYQTELKDLVVKLHGDATDYYLDLSTRTFSFEEMKEKLLHQAVTIEYAERWKPLKDNKQYISKLQQDDEVIFEE